MNKLLLHGVILFILVNPVKAQNSISGYIVSLETAKPIANATIFLNNKYNLPLQYSLRATSDSAGFYKIAGVKVGTYIINAWTTYRAMNQQYAEVIESYRIKVSHSLNVDFVFSENAFKYRLDFKFHVLEDRPRRSSDKVANKAVRPQIYIESRRDTVMAFFIENINNIKKR